MKHDLCSAIDGQPWLILVKHLHLENLDAIDLIRVDFPSFAELKRSLRGQPQLRVTGWTPSDEVVEEDWHAGSRAADRPDGADR